MTGSDNDKREFTDSDRLWFASLSGEEAPGDGSRAAREGRALRAALEDRRRQVDTDPKLLDAISDESLEARLQALTHQIRSEGIFDRAAPAASAAVPPAPSNVIEFPWWRRSKPLMALAASLFLGVVLVQQIADRPDLPAPPEMMGAGGTQQAHAPSPRQAAERLVAGLRQANLRPGLYQRRGTFVVDVNLLADDVPSAAPALRDLGLKPAIGFNRIEISAP